MAFGFLAFWLFGFLAFWLFGFLAFWLFGFLAFGFWLLAFGFWLLAFGFWLLAFSFLRVFHLFDFDLGFDLEEASLPPRQKRFPGRAAGKRREGALSWERIAPGPSGKGFC
ncbi:hypothetical protein [Duffyella gerundensis]|uniref:hypothetical protein n=1 Tax=Duffyella gerundensis TaxID=1619313 RepID=UPI0009E94587|nr:hypothetical protein [Duffyella gerundensis]